MTDTRLAGLRVVVTRSSDQAAPLLAAIESAGGVAIPLPLLEIRDPDDGLVELVAALAALRPHDWLAVTSPNGAERVVRSMSSGPRCQLAVLGEGTRAVFEAVGWTPDLVAGEPTAAGLADDFPPPEPGAAVLVARGNLARPTLPEALRAAGWPVEVVTTYVNIEPETDEDASRAAGAADVVVFASPSAVDRYTRRIGAAPRPSVCVGPITGAAAAVAGFEVVVAGEPSVAALVDALATLAD